MVLRKPTLTVHYACWAATLGCREGEHFEGRRVTSRGDVDRGDGNWSCLETIEFQSRFGCQPVRRWLFNELQGAWGHAEPKKIQAFATILTSMFYSTVVGAIYSSIVRWPLSVYSIDGASAIGAQWEHLKSGVASACSAPLKCRTWT